MADDKYVCVMDAASQKVAKDELFEDPKERQSQVNTFRDWITQQPNIKCPTDTVFLLKFLRAAKFSQLRAREILKNYLTVKKKYPQWVENIDMADPKIHTFLRTKYCAPMPKRDAQGRKILIVNEGAFSGDTSAFDVDTVLKGMIGLTFYLNMNEDNLVNGYVFFEDFTHFTIKHMTFWGMETMKKMSKLWEGNFPGRFKAFHFYNPGSLFESIMAVCKPLMSKKMQSRFHLHGKNMESIYKVIPMELFPDEYLPDDYQGKNQGSMQDIIEDLIRDFQTPAVRDRILYETSPEWYYDNKENPDVPSESFRKLNVD